MGERSQRRASCGLSARAGRRKAADVQLGQTPTGQPRPGCRPPGQAAQTSTGLAASGLPGRRAESEETAEGGLAVATLPPASGPRFSRLGLGFRTGRVPGASLPPGATALQPAWSAGCLLMLITASLQTETKGSVLAPGNWAIRVGRQAHRGLPPQPRDKMSTARSGPAGRGHGSIQLAGGWGASAGGQDGCVPLQRPPPPAWLSLRSGHTGHPQCPLGNRVTSRHCPGMGSWHSRMSAL